MNILDFKKIISDIYESYEPMAHMSERLFSGADNNEIKQITLHKTQNLTDEQKKRIYDEIFNWGPLEPLRQQTDIFDILILGKDHIYYETSHGIHKLDDCFLSAQSFKNFTEELFKHSKIIVSQKEPFGNGNSHPFRVHVTIPPVSSQTNITLRRHRNTQITFSQLLENNFFNKDQLSLIENILDSKKNFLVVGPTGSGKTTFLNSMIESLHDHERLVIIEDTDELKVNSPLSCKLISREVCPQNLNVITIEDLVKQSLRMRPDRIVVGEVRGPEAKDLLQALATGHSGSIGTLHAQSAQQAIYRLEMLIQMGAPQWELQSIRRLIHMSLDYLIVLKENRYDKGIEGIYKIASMEKFGLLLNKEY